MKKSVINELEGMVKYISDLTMVLEKFDCRIDAHYLCSAPSPVWRGEDKCSDLTKCLPNQESLHSGVDFA